MSDTQVFQSSFFKTEPFSEGSYSGAIFLDSATMSTARHLSEVSKSCGSCFENGNSFPYRFQLEQDVKILQQQLKEEMELHAILERAMEKDPAELSCLSGVPNTAHELLTNIAKLDATVSRLEQEMVSLHFQLTQERNERRLAEYRLNHSSSSSTLSPLTHSKHTNNGLHHSAKGNSCQEPRCRPSESTNGFFSTELELENTLDLAGHFHKKKIQEKTDAGQCQAVGTGKLPGEMPSKGLWDHPNVLSEEMVRCMRNIFMSLADSTVLSKSPSNESCLSPASRSGHLSNSSSWWSSSEQSIISSWVQSPRIDIQNNSDILATENSVDPYRVRGKLSWAEIGNYGLATEVSWMSVGKKQLEYASGALRRFRMLVEQLARVNPIHLSCDEKLAFWINLYNALIMHAYLAYGVPRSDMKLFSLMQKAAYTVGGHSYTAAAIEYVILKMKPPLHRPQSALLLAIHKLKVSEEQRKAAIDTYEPLVTFALSCGMYSSPAVRIYTAKSVREELEEAQRDFIQASVGLSSKGKLLVPKMLHCFAKSLVDESKLAVWISQYLPPHQAAFVEQCVCRRRQSVLASRNSGILPFDSHFRYLFLPDKILV